jgi:O-antigen ligase
MNHTELKFFYVYAILFALASAMLTSVAGINICVLLLLLATPWFWCGFYFEPEQKKQTILFLGLIAAICVWDVVTNLVAGAAFIRALWAVQHDLRTFAFIFLLWPVFAIERVARFALWALVWAFAAVAGVNWVATLAGFIKPGQYLWPTMHHLHGQMSVGCVFLLAQLMLTRNRLSWQAVIPMVVLLGAMFLANERRAGFLLLVAGLPLWIFLNRKRFSVGHYRWWLIGGGAVVLVVAASSSIVQTRLLLVWQEVTQYLERSPLDRANDFSSVGLRLQFYASIWEIIKEHWVLGVGSLQFADVFQKVNLTMGTTQPERFTNPHNEYLFMLATKGILGFALYLGIFVQGCRLVLLKPSEVQRVGLIMFVYLFMVSILMNSMMVDMEEGHFAMMALLIFLAPKSLMLEQELSKRD